MNTPNKITNFQKAIHRMQTDVKFVTVAMYLMQMEIIEDDSVGTACTDCVRVIRYSPSYFATLSVNECVAALIHEVYHKFLNFFPRFERWAVHHKTHSRGELLRTFNEAQDYFINHSVRHEWGLPLGEGWLYNRAHSPEATTTEALANKLLKKKDRNEPNSGAPEGTSKEAGKGEDVALPEEYKGDINNVPTEEQLQAMETASVGDAHNAGRMAAGRGSSPGGATDPMAAAIGNFQHVARFGWRALLARYATALAPTKHSYSRRSRRNVAANQPLIPGRVGRKPTTLVFAIDSSASTSGAMVAYATKEVQRALDTTAYNRVVVIWCSKDIPQGGVLEYRRGGTLDTTIRQAGYGTRFVPVFERVAEDYADADVITYLTDGGVGTAEYRQVAGIIHGRLKRTPVVWALMARTEKSAATYAQTIKRLGLGTVCYLPPPTS